MNIKILVPLVLTLILSGCVNGKLDPRVAPIVSALDVAACNVVPVLVGNQEVGTVCQAAAGVVNGLLAGFSAPASVDAGVPMMARRVLPTVEVRVPVKMHGATIGHLRGDVAAFVQAKLDAMPVDGGVTRM